MLGIIAVFPIQIVVVAPNAVVNHLIVSALVILSRCWEISCLAKYESHFTTNNQGDFNTPRGTFYVATSDQGLRSADAASRGRAETLSDYYFRFLEAFSIENIMNTTTDDHPLTSDHASCVESPCIRVEQGLYGRHAVAAKAVRAGEVVSASTPVAHRLLSAQEDNDEKRRCARCFAQESDTGSSKFGRCTR